MNEDEDLVEVKWSRDSWVLGGIVGAILIAFVAISLVYVKGIFDRAAEQKSRDEFITCVRNWSDAYTRRADLLQTLSTARTDALDARTRSEDRFYRRLLANPKAYRAELLDLLYVDQTYLDASNAYRRAQRKHPVPASPQFVCSNGKQGVAPGRVSERGPGPAPTPTATAPSASRSAPQPTVAVTVPIRPTVTARTISGPHTTRTTVRTITAAPTRRPTPTRSSHPRPPPPSAARPNPVRSIVCSLPLPLCLP